MSAIRLEAENHAVERVGWLRAAVLGANDGVVSTASLLVGVAAASPGRSEVIIAGVAGLVAGAMSMAAGEYVSVSSQADAEAADIARERIELDSESGAEHEELAQIYIARGVEPVTARQVATQLMARDALGAHSRDELGISPTTRARPFQAALTSAATFTAGAAIPLAIAALVPVSSIVAAVTVASLAALALLGAAGARAGNAPLPKAIARVLFWGALAMAITAAIGRLVGTAV